MRVNFLLKLINEKYSNSSKCIFLVQCGTTVPTEKKITKVENIIGTPKKVFR